MTTEKEKNDLMASEANLLDSLLRLCKTMWTDECMNRSCEDCTIGRKKKWLKEECFNLF